jgi:hypothetical protein
MYLPLGFKELTILNQTPLIKFKNSVRTAKEHHSLQWQGSTY